jgi:hypothetical protein
MYINLHKDYNLFSKVLSSIGIKYITFKNICSIDKKTD